MAVPTTPLRLSWALTFFLLATTVAVVAAHPASKPAVALEDGPHVNRLFRDLKARSKLTSSLAKTGIVPEAYSGSSWQCGHSSGKGKGCFLTTAKYVGRVISKCAQCGIHLFGNDQNNDGTNEVILNPPVYDKPVTIKGDSSKCPSCAKQTSDTPKCGGKFLGIGSKRKGRSCRLIKAGGCWPKTSDRVLHDCGPGAECKFKVTSAKAKIWCCRPYTKKFWKRWQNLFRCSSKARSKSKDRDGAVVMWE